MTTASWTVVVPVKAPAIAKTRLALPHALRTALARAFALDTVTAVVACQAVRRTVVVCDDADLAAVLAELGAEVLARPLALNTAIVAAADGSSGPVVALPADLPALTPATLADALAEAAAHDRAVVADRSGNGTVLLAARSAEALLPQFGPGSFAAHRLSGAVPLEDRAWDDLRCDVDTADDLAVAAALGVGPATTLLLRGSVVTVQATVNTFDPDTRTGTVLLDDGVELPFDTAAVDSGGMRLLRFGQRVRIRTAGDGADERVTYLILATLADPE